MYNFSNIIFFTENDQNNFQIEENVPTALSHSLISPNVNIPDWFFESGENVYGDPLFCSSENGDFSLAANSPALDAGENGVNMGVLGMGCEAIELAVDAGIAPNLYELHQNYPNPFNPTTILSYNLSEDNFVKVIIYDVLGNIVNNLVNDKKDSGYNTVEWNATNNQGQPVSAGVYLYSIEAGDFRQTKKMILLK